MTIKITLIISLTEINNVCRIRCRRHRCEVYNLLSLYIYFPVCRLLADKMLLHNNITYPSGGSYWLFNQFACHQKMVNSICKPEFHFY